jgi:predicted O-linked N-acetylglucosamine transferase (SPINDLY family)
MDYSFWDPIQVPEGEERWFVERIVRLPDVRWCYAAPDYAPPVSDPPVLQRGYVTFGSFNNLAKLNSGVIELWVRVLEAVPRSRLLLSWRTFADPHERARIASAFSAHGLEPSRLELRCGAPTHAGVMGEYREVDIALDPFPFSGCLTSCEALWMGVPVVTWPRSRPVSRQTQAFLTAIGRTEWIARGADDYLRIASSLAADPTHLAALRRDQRARMAGSPLCDGRRFARNLEAIYRELWRAFAAGERPEQIKLASA